MNWRTWFRDTRALLDLEAFGALATIALLVALALGAVVFLSAPVWLK